EDMPLENLVTCPQVVKGQQTQLPCTCYSSNCRPRVFGVMGRDTPAACASAAGVYRRHLPGRCLHDRSVRAAEADARDLPIARESGKVLRPVTCRVALRLMAPRRPGHVRLVRDQAPEAGTCRALQAAFPCRACPARLVPGR